MMHTTRLDEPNVRVGWALWRLSRDRWVPPDESVRICSALVDCAAKHNNSVEKHRIYSHSMPSGCRMVGMVHGIPPFDFGTVNYRVFLARLRTGRKLKNPEMFILNLQLKEMKNGY